MLQEKELAITMAMDDQRRQGKFQPFRRLFGRKRKRATVQGFEETELKPSHSTDDLCNGLVSAQEETIQHLRESNSLGSRAFSHESIFISEGPVEKPCSEETMSQENVSDKVRNIQRQIAHNIKFGQKPVSMRKSEGDEGSSDEEEPPRRPLQVLAQVEPEPQEAEVKEKVSFATHDVTQHRAPVKSPRAKRPPPPGTIESINLDAVPQSAPRLDNTAAKHKLSVKPKNQRVSRKHRRFIQGFLEVNIFGVVQEQTELVEEAEVWREEYVRSRIIDNQETPEQSKKQRLQEEQQECLEIQHRHEEEVEEERRREQQRVEELKLEEKRMHSEQEEFLRRVEEERRQWEKERRQKEEERRKEEEERRYQEEKRGREEEERKREEEERRRKEEERWQQEKERRMEEEGRMQQEEERKREEEQKRQQEEERRREEEEKRREEEEKRQQEEERRREEEEKRREEEEKRQQEEERRREEAERRQWEEERKREEEDQRRKLEEEQQLKKEEDWKRLEVERKKLEEERHKAEEERRQQELIANHLRLEEEIRQREAEEAKRKKKETEAEKQRLFEELEEKQHIEGQVHLQEEQRQQLKEEEAENKILAHEKRRKEEDKRKQQEEVRDEEEIRCTDEEYRSTSDSEWKRKAEELRWREMEERRPFTFKVSSGEKQILFQKVNLSPVTPVPGQQSDPAVEAKECTPGVAEPSTLPSSMYVPHTAILVTGAQLCGTAVNLDQIKDTACKSLLGISEDKKVFGMPLGKSKASPDHKSEKVKSLNESILSADQSSAAVLAEWASIRSRIFKSTEDGKYQEHPDQNRNQPKEEVDQPPFAHNNLRKTMSTNARFSIIPARKKFPDSNRNSEVFSQVEQEGEQEDSDSNQSVQSPSSPSKTQNKGGKAVRISDSPEEFQFAKDLPSFLVPSLPHESPKSQTGSLSQVESGESDTTDYGDQRGQSGDEKPLPFGIKLRRTNYSLRFHSEQSTEKRKKRYSAGDSFDGIPVPLTSVDHDCAFSEKTSPAMSPEERVDLKVQGIHSAEPRSKPGRSPLSSVCSETDKPPLYQKPATLPKPSDIATPLSSPLPKPGRKSSGDTVPQRLRGVEQTSDEPCSQNKEALLESVQSQKTCQGDDEPKEKKSFFPSISIPWREKTDRRTELIRREKPSLQSRHSLDSSRPQEKETGPLWITLALQKQKGFREQQLTREERRNQREAKLAEKQAKERELAGLISPTDSKRNENTSPPKAQTPEENKRPETLLARFERRDNLKKANTLPSSVTVEIADSTPSPPAAKDIKRFPPSDSPQVSTEPAWLALAKRKAKAWSDCPQIIK